MYLIVNCTVTFCISHQRSLLIFCYACFAVSFFYYFYEVGLWGYLYRRYCPQVAVPPPAVGVPLDVAGGNVMDAEAQPHAVQHNLQHQGWSLGRLLHLLQTPPVLPQGSGPAKDVLALLLAFFCSLFPS